MGSVEPTGMGIFSGQQPQEAQPSTPRPRVGTVEYKVVSGTSASDPGSGSMRFNTSTQSDATQLYFDQYSAGSVDQSGNFAALNAGDVLDLQQKDNSAVVASYTVNAVTDNGGWYTIDVTAGASSGMPIGNNKAALVGVNQTPVEAPLSTLYAYYVAKISALMEASDQADICSQIGAQGWRLRFVGSNEGDGTRRVWFEYSYAATDPPPVPPVTE